MAHNCVLPLFSWTVRTSAHLLYGSSSNVLYLPQTSASRWPNRQTQYRSPVNT